jgi:threonine/homoserine/homoserine lactone efflux protein
MGMAVAAFLPAGASIGATTVLFGVIFSIETAVFFALLIAAPTRLTRWMASSRLRRRLDMGTGVVLIGLAVPLAVEP